MKEVDGGICAISDISVYGLRDAIRKQGITIISCKGSAVGIFSQNKFKSASIILNESRLPCEIELILINDGCANVFTGEKGFKNQEELINIVAKNFGISPKSVCSISTGSIGNNFDMNWLKLVIEKLTPTLKDETYGHESLSIEFIDENSTYKQFAIEINGIRIGGIAKGVHINKPNMAMTTVILFTDAQLPPELVYYTKTGSFYEIFQNCFNKAFDISFNMIATNEFVNINDIAILVTTNKKKIDLDNFQIGLNRVCVELAKMIVEDCADNNRRIKVDVIGAKTNKDAINVAKTIAKSCYHELNFFNNIENFGTILSRIGASNASVCIDKITIVISNGAYYIVLFEEGKLIEKSFNKVKNILNSENILIKVDLGIGIKHASSWGCSL